MRTLTRRTVDRLMEQVGPEYDPYAREIWVLREAWSDGSKRRIWLTNCSLMGEKLKVDDYELVSFDDRGVDVRHVFERIAGFDPALMIEAYHKNWEPDPMGTLEA